MERSEPSGGGPSLMGIDYSSLMGQLGGIHDQSLMEPFDGDGGGLPSQMNDTPENGSIRQFVEVHANNGNEESPGDGAARIPEVVSSAAVKNKKKRGDREDGSQPNKKSLHRVTCQQLEILEGFFSICAHPDDNQRRQLSESTGLLLHQVKFWFQNKRTHVKHLSGREENYRLKVENDTLKEENNRLRQAQSNAPAPAPCPRCINDPGHLILKKEVEHLRAQNQVLQQQLQLLQSTANEIPPMSMHSASGAFQFDPSLENVFVVQHDEQMVANLAQNAAQEFLILADPNIPLWLNVPGGLFETLNMDAYSQTFPGQIGVDVIERNTEATRASAVVMMDPKSLVEYLMDADSYGTMFPGLVTAAVTTQVFSCPTSREECYDGAMQMMIVELVFPSPLVSARKCTFVRYCKRLEQGAIAVVDVSLNDGARYRKMPSGVLVEPIRCNTCKVTAIDHVLVDGTYTHGPFDPCLSGLLFGARRRVASLARQCARVRDVFHVTNCTLNVTSRWRKRIMKLADNLLASFTSSVAAYPDDAWTVKRGLGTEQDIKIMYKAQEESSSSSHMVLVCASASFLVPLHMAKVFGLLKNKLLRGKWDVLVKGGSVKEEVRVANGVGSDDAVSILHVKHGQGANRETMMILQNTSYDASGAFMVYSSLDKQLMGAIAKPGDNQAMSNIKLLPAGFSLVPLTDPAGQDGTSIEQPGATVMTVGFQILMKLADKAGLYDSSVKAALQLMTESIASIKDALLNSHPVFYKSIQRVN